MLGEDTSSPYSFTWNNVTAGSYSLTAKATGDLGATTTSSVVSITVNLPASSEPVAHWRFDEGSGLTATDSSANGNNGTLRNGATWGAGQILGSLSLDGQDDRVDVASSSTFNISGDISIAAWIKRAKITAVDNFDSYSTGSALGSLNRGSGWSGSWTADISGKTVETSPSGGQGGDAARQLTTSENYLYRQFPALTVGIVSWKMRLSITNPNDFMGVVLRKAAPPGNGAMYVRFGPSGNIEIADGDTYIPIQAYSVDTWYQCEIEFDNVNQAGKYRARVDGGTWTSWVTVNGGSYTSVSYLDLDTSASNAHTIWYDDIKVSSNLDGHPAENRWERLGLFA